MMRSDRNEAPRKRCCGISCESVVIVLMYVSLAVFSTWPLAKNAATSLPLGASSGQTPPYNATVPLFNLWTVWWNSSWFQFNARGAVEPGYWNAPIFHPARNAFAFSEPQPTTAVVAPVIWLSGSSVLAYNVYLLTSLVLNAVLGWRLLRFLRIQRFVAAGGGAAMLLLPIVHWQRDVLQLVPVWGILWTWLALAKFGRESSWRHGSEAGAAFAVSFLMCVHHALFLFVLLVGAAWILPRRWRCREFWLSLAAMFAAAAVLAGPVVIKLKSSLSEHSFTRNPDTVARLSARPVDYTRTQNRQLISPGNLFAASPRRYSPGTLKMALAVFGIGFGLARRRWRRWTLFLLMTGGLAFALSLGTNLNISGWQPWQTLTEHVPGFSQVRSAFRFAWFVQMSVVLLAAQGLHWLVAVGRLLIRHRDSERLQRLRGNLRFLARVILRDKGRRLFANRSVRLGVPGLLFLLGVLAALETLPKPVQLAAPPDLSRHSEWLTFVRDRTHPGKVILCLPMAATNKVAAFDVTTRWMMFQSVHGKAMLNGYSGFFPGHYFRSRTAIQEGMKPEVLQSLIEQDVDLIVVDRSKYPPSEFQAMRSGHPRVVQVFESPQARSAMPKHGTPQPFSQIDIYRIEAR